MAAAAPIVRFEMKFNKNPYTGCWEWAASTKKGGYGWFWFRNKMATASRVAYILYVGEIPDKLLVCHKCDNPGCVNPGHLFLGTAKLNTNDAQNKGRFPVTVHPSSVTYANGCRCNDCKQLRNSYKRSIWRKNYKPKARTVIFDANKPKHPHLRFEQARIANNQSLRTAAKGLGISRRALGWYEDGTTRVKPSKLIKMAEYYKVTIEYLLNI